MPKTKRPKIVFIDWSGTLSKSKFWGHLEQSSKRDRELFLLLENSLFKRNTNLINPWMKAGMTTEEVNTIIAKDISVHFDKIHKEFIKSCELMKFVSESIPYLIKKIRKSGTKVYIATNNMDSFNKWTIPAMKLLDIFDGVVNSFTTKALKHDFDDSGKSLFFDDVLSCENVSPEDTILIDDSEDKGGLLTNYGINYIRITRQETLESNLEEILSYL